mmetsp:Transcript_65200/g.204316  ORF Transcript_65200/g.204316 Transcript_65200/m.204316 type:complete len:320 (+) Transcript_65200:194-1153(+)
MPLRVLPQAGRAEDEGLGHGVALGPAGCGPSADGHGRSRGGTGAGALGGHRPREVRRDVRPDRQRAAPGHGHHTVRLPALQGHEPDHVPRRRGRRARRAGAPAALVEEAARAGGVRPLQRLREGAEPDAAAAGPDLEGGGDEGPTEVRRRARRALPGGPCAAELQPHPLGELRARPGRHGRQDRHVGAAWRSNYDQLQDVRDAARPPGGRRAAGASGDRRERVPPVPRYEALGVREHLQERLHGQAGGVQRRRSLRPRDLLRRVQQQERRVRQRRPHGNILGALRDAAVPRDMRAHLVHGRGSPKCGRPRAQVHRYWRV